VRIVREEHALGVGFVKDDIHAVLSAAEREKFKRVAVINYAAAFFFQFRADFVHLRRELLIAVLALAHRFGKRAYAYVFRIVNFCGRDGFFDCFGVVAHCFKARIRRTRLKPYVVKH
jgi:hypothetical protein